MDLHKPVDPNKVFICTKLQIKLNALCARKCNDRPAILCNFQFQTYEEMTREERLR